MVRGASQGGALLAALVVLTGVAPGSAQDLPAVSQLNGKLEFDAGFLSLPAPSFVGRAAGTLTLPVGSDFGIQVDMTAAASSGFTGSAAIHAFTRDPASYLIGGTLGVISTPGALVVAAGPEAELYLDRWTLEAWAGASFARPTTPGPDRIAPFVMGTLAYYPQDDLRLSIGVSALDGYVAVHAGSEYQLEGLDLPLSIVGDARIGQDGAVLATVGLRAYLGGPPKSLIRRHREDDPVDRGTALYGATGGHTLNPVVGSTAVPPDPVPPVGGSPPHKPRFPPSQPPPPDPVEPPFLEPHTCPDALYGWNYETGQCELI